VAFPQLPGLPALPASVDPDAWLASIHGQHFVRHPFVKMGPCVLPREATMWTWTGSGNRLDLCVDAHQQVFVIRHRQHLLKQVPIKGLQKTVLPFEQFAALMCQQALSEQRRLQQARLATRAVVR
jgi:hypothetical protein